MKYEYIEPFIKATKDAFSVTLDLEVKVEKPFAFQSKKDFLDISALIGLAGEVKGAVLLSFSFSSSLKVSERFTGSKSKHVDDIVIDALGELVNIVAGNAKEGLLQYRIYISLPKIVQNAVSLVIPKGSLFMTIPIKTSLGDLNLIVALAESR